MSPAPRAAAALILLGLLSADAAPAIVSAGGPSPLPGPGGCVRDRDREVSHPATCTPAVAALRRPVAVAVSRGGRAVYVAAADSDSVATLTRDPASGRLRPARRPSEQSCIQAPGASGRCTRTAAGLRGADALALSPTGDQLYVGSLDSSAVVPLSVGHRGVLRQLAGSGGCVQGHPVFTGGAERCPQRSGALTGVMSLAVSPDGRSLYAASAGTSPQDQTVVALHRRPDGGLTPFHARGGCVQSPGPLRCATSAPGLRGPSAVLVSPDDRFVYVASAVSSAVVAFTRDRGGGGLVLLRGPGGCVYDAETPRAPADSGCSEAAGGLGGARGLALSPDGRELYVASFDPGAVTVLSRDPASGRLAPRSGAGACLQAIPSPACPNAAPELRGAVALLPAPSGGTIYVAAEEANTVIALGRDPATGNLSAPPPAGPADSAVNGPGALAISPDGRDLYLAAPFDDAVQALSLAGSAR